MQEHFMMWTKPKWSGMTGRFSLKVDTCFKLNSIEGASTALKCRKIVDICLNSSYFSKVICWWVYNFALLCKLLNVPPALNRKICSLNIGEKFIKPGQIKLATVIWKNLILNQSYISLHFTRMFTMLITGLGCLPISGRCEEEHKDD